MTEKINFGSQGELAVAKWLQDRSFIILAKNYRTRCGEVDIIAQKNELVVFVEVKTRKKAYFQTSLVVTYSKQQKIARAAKWFILEKQLFEHILRFDVATLTPGKNEEFEVSYIENAFVP